MIQYYQNKQWVTTTRTFEVDKDRGYIWFNDGAVFDRGTYWRVLYKPGYALVNVPADLKGVCKVVVTRIFKSIEKEGVSSESFGDSQTNYNLENMFGKKELMTLDRYKRQFMA